MRGEARCSGFSHPVSLPHISAPWSSNILSTESASRCAAACSTVAPFAVATLTVGPARGEHARPEPLWPRGCVAQRCGRSCIGHVWVCAVLEQHRQGAIRAS